MSYKCDVCKTIQSNGTKQNKMVTEIRKVTYPPVYKYDGSIDKIPVGFEPVKELNVCNKCFVKKDPIVVDSKILSK